MGGCATCIRFPECNCYNLARENCPKYKPNTKVIEAVAQLEKDLDKVSDMLNQFDPSNLVVIWDSLGKVNETKKA